MSRNLHRHFTRFNEEREKKGLKPVSRREFMKIAAMTAAGFYAPALCSCDSGDSGDKSGADGSATDGPSIPSGYTSVGISRHVDVVTNVRAAIDLAGGLSKIVGGDRVVIKPNLTGPMENMCTRADVLRGVVQAVKTRTDAAHITLAECTALGSKTANWADMAGYTAMAQQEGINTAWWDELPYVSFRDPRWQFIKEEKRVPQMLDPAAPEYDHFIEVPILKNHQDVPYSNAVFTGCIKLLVGVIPYDAPGGRMTPAPAGIHDVNLGEQVAELHCIVPRVTMNVIDSINCVVANGPAGASYKSVVGNQEGPMVVANPGLIIASPDIGACDSMGLAVLKYYCRQMGAQNTKGGVKYVNRSVWADAQIQRVGQLGLGLSAPDKIVIEDRGVDNIDAIKAEWI